MKDLFYILISLFFISCAKKQTATQLAQADSLMISKPDSAFSILKSISPDDVCGIEQNAYYALLYTQAQYKNFNSIKNDSLINIAVNYYTDHFDCDKLTRSLMYKGGVWADLNYNKLALDCYKQAEQVADTTDYLTYGLLNFRLGELYQNSYIKNSEHIKRYKKANIYFKKANHKTFENNTLSHIGQLYITRNKDSATFYLNHAINMAKKREDKQSYYHNIHMLAEFYDYHKINREEAKDIELEIYCNRDSIRIGAELYSNLSTLYAKLGIIDSAIYYARLFPKLISSTDMMRYHMMYEEIAIAQHDYKNAYKHYKLSDLIADSLVKNSKSEEYYAIEKQFDNQVANEKMERYKSQVIAGNYIILIVFLIVAIFIILSVVYWKRKKRLLADNVKYIEQLQTDLQLQQMNTENILEDNLCTIANLNQSLEQKTNLEQKLKEIIAQRIAMMRELMSIRYQFASKPDVFTKQFCQFIMLNRQSLQACDAVIDMVNTLNYNIIDVLMKEYPSLTKADILLLSVVSLKFSIAEICVYLNMSIETTYVKRSKLLSKIHTTLPTIETFLEEKINEITKQNHPANNSCF